MTHEALHLRWDREAARAERARRRGGKKNGPVQLEKYLNFLEEIGAGKENETPRIREYKGRFGEAG